MVKVHASFLLYSPYAVDKQSNRKKRMGKNKYGQYFTKETIASFMVSLISKPLECEILEPSCGEGVFLRALFSCGFKKLSAYEIDKSLGKDYPFIKYESFISSPITETFDVIIGNPPYIRWKNIEEELKEELANNELWNQYFNSLCDYLFIFILKSIKQLNDKGELIFICSEYWLNTTNSLTLRNYMCENGYFTEIYHFKESPLFDNVNASLIIFKYVKSHSPKVENINLYYYVEEGMPSLEKLKTKECFSIQTIPQFQKNRRWILAEKSVQCKMAQLEKSCALRGKNAYERIGDYFDIANGMVSGLDKAFVVSDAELASFNDMEKSSLIDVLKAKDLNQYVFKTSSKYVFLKKEMSEKEFYSMYPNLGKHFFDYKEQLFKRYQYNRKIPYWEFVFPRSQNLFEKKCLKIFVPCKERISNKNFFRFCLAPVGYYPLQDVTGIVPKDICKENIYYVLAYLNLSDVFSWLKYNGIVKGYIVEFSEKPLSQIPYRTINWDDKRETVIHDQICNEMSSYISDNKADHLEIIKSQFKKLLYE